MGAWRWRHAWTGKVGSPVADWSPVLEDRPTNHVCLWRIGWRSTMGQTPEGTGHRLGSGSPAARRVPSRGASGTHAGWGHPAFRSCSRNGSADVGTGVGRRCRRHDGLCVVGFCGDQKHGEHRGSKGTAWSFHPRNGSSLNRRCRRFRRWRGRNASTQGPCRCHLAGEGHARSMLLTICVICAICGSNCRFQVHGSSLYPLGKPCVNAR
jgi:hypothetical protein